MANLLTPSRAAASFENVARAMQLELSDSLQSAFRTGESLQNQVWDRSRGGFPTHVTPPDAVQSGLQGAGAGWGPMPFPVIPPSATAVPTPNATRDISPNYPFEPHYLDVLGSRMHYVDIGSGDPILLLHGNPTWSYLWRNIIPHLAPLGRCIAPDLIGFGRSDKPDIEYRWEDHVRYLEAFIEKMGLRNITLVLHDQGSGLGFHYAMRNQNNIKAIAFFEAIIRPYRWEQFSTPEFRELFRKFRSGGVGGEGWKMIVEQNMFIEGLLPQSAGRPLSEAEMNYYREPFKDPKSRVPIWRFPQETPIGGEPPDVWKAVSTYSQRLQQSHLPKLLLYAEPGALVTKEHLEWAKNNMRNLETVYVGEGSHFLQESSPHTIGKAVARWIRRLPDNERPSGRAVAGHRETTTTTRPSPGPSKAGATPGISADVVQSLIDQAAYFNLFSSPDCSRRESAIHGRKGIVGFQVTESLRPFDMMAHPTNAARPIAGFSHRWMFAPDDFVAGPGQLPPPTPLNPNVSQRFVMLDGDCEFGNGRDGFFGFGTGHTFPTRVKGRSQLLVTAVGTIVHGFGRFAGHDQGTYVYCGKLDSQGGFTGNLMLRVMDQEKTLYTETSQPATEWQQCFDGETTYIIFRGEAVPSDPVRTNVGPNGKPIGLIVEQGLKLQRIVNVMTPEGVFGAASQLGDRRIGRVTAHVAFDPQSASGTNQDPVPFTAYDEFEFLSPKGGVVGKLIADTSEGRVFNTSLAGQQGIRFGGVGRIHHGEGLFQGVRGLMTDNSVVVFEPHVSASVYVLRIEDPEARVHLALSRI
ncbi:MAG TPA: haloalkane dehalogenase [Pirellulaceae bacterium]|nr:haloalkane dehalogenase [Pirellulaceae bacterium]